MCSTEEVEAAQATLLTVRKTLDDKGTPDDITLDDLLKKAEVSYESYIKSLQICCRGNSIVTQRKPAESWINTYNPNVIRVYKAKMDLQYIYP